MGPGGLSSDKECVWQGLFSWIPKARWEQQDGVRGSMSLRAAVVCPDLSLSFEPRVLNPREANCRPEHLQPCCFLTQLHAAGR